MIYEAQSLIPYELLRNVRHGLLGQQMVATIIQNNTDYECLVIGVGHDFYKEALKKNVTYLTSGDRQIVGFSNLGGRPELYNLKSDPNQENNITGQHMDIAKDMHRMLLLFMKDTNVPQQLQEPHLELRM
ncbi:hypothetical protein ACFLYQ_04550 [Chloroflexota bacterium]